MPFRPKKMERADNFKLDGLRTNGSPMSGPDAVAKLEAQVNGL